MHLCYTGEYMARPKHKHPRTYARNRAAGRATTRSGRERVFESDGVYFLKLVGVIMLGTLWLKFQSPVVLGGIPIVGIPIGLLAGLLLVHLFEPLQADRKIWFAMLVVVSIVTLFLPAGIVI